MSKLFRFFAFIVLTVALTGCAEYEMLPDASGKTARVRVTSNEPNVYAIPGGICLGGANQVIYAANISSPPFFGSDYEERIEKSLGMPKMPIELFYVRKGPYVSQEYRVKAGEPIIFFVLNTDGALESFFYALDDARSLDKSIFAFNFVPEAGHDYQIVFNEETNFLTTNGYFARLADITNGKFKFALDKFQRVYSCKTEARRK